MVDVKFEMFKRQGKMLPVLERSSVFPCYDWNCQENKKSSIAPGIEEWVDNSYLECRVTHIKTGLYVEYRDLSFKGREEALKQLEEKIMELNDEA